MFRVFLLSLILAVGALCVSANHVALAAEEEAGGEHAAKPKEGGKGEGEGKSKLPEDVSGGRFAGDPVYVHLEPCIIPIITDSGAEQIVTLLIDIEVKDFDAGDKVHSEMPKVRDALMRALYGGLGSGSLRNGKMVDVTAIKFKANAAISNVIGADNVRDVLIQGVAQRVL